MCPTYVNGNSEQLFYSYRYGDHFNESDSEDDDESADEYCTYGSQSGKLVNSNGQVKVYYEITQIHAKRKRFTSLPLRLGPTKSSVYFQHLISIHLCGTGGGGEIRKRRHAHDEKSACAFTQNDT